VKYSEFAKERNAEFVRAKLENDMFPRGLTEEATRAQHTEQ